MEGVERRMELAPISRSAAYITVSGTALENVDVAGDRKRY